MMNASLHYKAFVMFPNQGTISSLFGVLHREGFNFSSEDDLMKVFKDAQVKFPAERISNVYMLQNSEITVGGLQLSSTSRSEVVEQSETTMVSRSDVQFYSESRLALGSTGAQ